MPKYLFKVNYTASGIAGVRKDGGSKRREVTEKMAESVGGKLESYYFAFGATDVYSIGDLPSNAAAANLATAVSATGAVSVETVVLLTPEEIDEAVKSGVEYSPPGA